jgi:NADH-quinone oxidoreductase subunit J
METAVFLVAGAIVLIGAVGVVLSANPVHAALSLVATLFGIAVLFIAQEAHFLAAVQVIVYAGAIVVLFLFVIMLLGRDRVEDLTVEPLVAQRPAAIVMGVAILGLTLLSLLSAGSTVTGAERVLGSTTGDDPNVTILARVLFTDYVYAFEITAILLTIAVVGAVVLARRLDTGDDLPADEPGQARR